MIQNKRKKRNTKCKKKGLFFFLSLREFSIGSKKTDHNLLSYENQKKQKRKRRKKKCRTWT